MTSLLYKYTPLFVLFFTFDRCSYLSAYSIQHTAQTDYMPILHPTEIQALWSQKPRLKNVLTTLKCSKQSRQSNATYESVSL